MRFADDLGEPREALVGRTWRELGDSVAAVEPLVRESQEAIMAGTPVSREVEIDGPGGPEWRACTFLPFGRDALLVITEDITERKEAAAELNGSPGRSRPSGTGSPRSSTRSRTRSRSTTATTGTST